VNIIKQNKNEAVFAADNQNIVNGEKQTNRRVPMSRNTNQILPAKSLLLG
jgi:hypothetical protein